jgi:3-oxoacyl-[acyl-carrier-protein] synthase-3
MRRGVFAARSAPPSRASCLKQLMATAQRPTVVRRAAEQLIGVGSSVPETFLTNSDLAQLVDTNDEWIVTRTGIRKRHVLGKGETLTEHAAASAQRALDMAGVSPKEIDLILFATSSPDDAFGSACLASLGRSSSAWALLS